MKDLLSEFRISTGLDSHRIPPPGLQAQIQKSARLRSFQRSMQILEQRLRRPPKVSAPPSLHRSIMDAVDRCASAEEVRGNRCVSWLVPSAAILLVAALVVPVLHSQRAKEPSAPLVGNQQLPSPSEAVSLSQHLGMMGSEAVLTPMEEELDHVSRDLADLAQFVLASVP